MKIVFLGTPEFAVPILETLIARLDIKVKAVITQPDKKFGRKQEIKAPAVKIAAEMHNIEVLQPKNHRELEEMINDLEVDFFVVVAYGMILKTNILNKPKHGCINVHASLLPKYRGASPIHEALINGDKETGVSIMEMNEEMDTGPIYLSQRISIDNNDTTESLSKKLALLSSQLLPDTLVDIEEGYLTSIPQNNALASHCKKIKKEDGKVNKDKSAKEIINMYRAYKQWPGIFVEKNGKTIKLTEIEQSQEKVEAGELIVNEKKLLFGTSTNAIQIKKLQPEGKNEMDAQSFINGNQTFFK